eukprot:g2756.t1
MLAFACLSVFVVMTALPYLILKSPHSIDHAVRGRKQWGTGSVHHPRKHLAHASAPAADSKAAAKKGAWLPSDEDEGGCTEKGFCGNLRPLDNGQPHPNCNGWAKDCPCACRPHKPRPKRKVVELPPLRKGKVQPHELWKARPEQATDAVVSGGELRVLGTVDESGDPYWSHVAEEMKTPKLDPDRGAGKLAADKRVALVALQNGPLAVFFNYFAASCAANGPDVHFFIFHTEDERKLGMVDFALLPANVHLVHMPLKDVAQRVLDSMGDQCEAHGPGEQNSPEALMDILNEPSSTNMGSKINDMKMIYGRIFAKEVSDFAYWGWFDLDMLFGDLKSTIAQYIPEYDVLTFPDGGLGAAYAAGQLTMFRNVEYFRECFTRDTHWAMLVCEPGNRLWDEKYTLPHAMRNRDVRLVVDMSAQFSGSAVAMASEFQWYNGHVLRKSTGQTTRRFDNSAAHALELLKGARQKHNCVGYWQDYTWACFAAQADGTTMGLVYKWKDLKWTVEYRPPAVYSDAPQGGKRKVERAAFMHLHTWKRAKTYKLQKDGYFGKRFIFKTNNAGEPKEAVLTVSASMA